jgi:hypothetical protein
MFASIGFTSAIFTGCDSKPADTSLKKSSEEQTKKNEEDQKKKMEEGMKGAKGAKADGN